MRGNWQDFNWHDAQRGPSAIAELLVLMCVDGVVNSVFGSKCNSKYWTPWFYPDFCTFSLSYSNFAVFTVIFAALYTTKSVTLNGECRWGAHLPSFSREPVGGLNHRSLWRMTSATPDLRLPSQRQNITAPWPVPNYTAWWQTHCAYNLSNMTGLWLLQMRHASMAAFFGGGRVRINARDRLTRRVTIRYDTIRDAILTCARKPTWVSLIYRTEPTTKKCKNRRKKLKVENRYAQK